MAGARSLLSNCASEAACAWQARDILAFTSATSRQQPCSKRMKTCTRAWDSNLGALSHIVEGDANIDFSMPDLEAFQPGVHFDAPAVLGSGILLLVLLGLMFERILGLDRYFAGLITKYKWTRLAEQRKQDVADRASLERMYNKDEE